MNKQRTYGIVLQYLQMGLNIVIMLVYTPIMLKMLGKNEYGIYNIANSTITYLSFLSLGFGASYIRFYSIRKKENDDFKIAKLNGLYLLVFLILGFIALVCGLILASNVRIFYNDTYSEDDIRIAKILMIFLSINLAWSFPASVFSSYITAHEKFIFQKLLNMGKTVIGPVVNIILLYLGYNSIGMVITTTCVTFIIDLINIFYCFSKLKMNISFKNPEFLLLKEIFFFSIFIGINQIIDQINWQTDKLILGKIIDGSAVAVYTVGANINNMFTTLSTAVSNVFSPKINQIVQSNINFEEKNKKLNNIFVKVGRIQFLILSLVLTGFIFFGKFFIQKWAGEGYDNSYYVALLLMIPAIVPLIQNIGIEIQRARNKHQFRSIVYLIMAIINVGISIGFVYLWGEIGAALGTTISLIVANGIIMNIYYQKKLNINIVDFWYNIFTIIPGMIIPVLFGIFLMIFYEFHNLFDFSLFIILYVIIYCFSLWFFGMNHEEKKMVKNIMSKFLQRKEKNNVEG